MLKIYNTLTRKKEIFKPIEKGVVGMYSCGPTVYNYAHIGNLRTYIFNDILKRSLIYLGYKVTHVMNITDVDDKTIKASEEENIPLKELTRKYESILLNDTKELNIISPTNILRATESISDMIVIIEKLLKKGYAYKTSDGVYFSISKFKKYGKLANLQKINKTKARIISDEYDKSSIQDFALWKFNTLEDRNILWNAPFGKGRPGWHIECSAMSMKILGEHIDIHTGGQDLIFPHHTNEIAQSEAATEKKFVNYWIHTGFLNMKDKKMSKSDGNIINLLDLKEEGYNPMHYRYLCLQTHYKKPLYFSFENLDAAKNAFEHLKRRIIEIKKYKLKGKDETQKYIKQFTKAVNDDLNIPKALQVVWHSIDDFNFDHEKKHMLLEKFDEVLGLGIKNIKEEVISIPKNIQNIINEREIMRKNKRWVEADILRQRLKEKGYLIEDRAEGPKVGKI